MGIISIQFLQPLADLMGDATIVIEIQETASLLKIIEGLVQARSSTIQEIFFNEHKEWDPKVIILINGKVMNNSNQGINSGDHILVLPPVSGG